MFHQRTTTATMPARTTGAPGASNGQAILAASAFFQQQQQQQQQQAPHHNNGKITVTFQRLPCLIPSWEKLIYFGVNIFFQDREAMEQTICLTGPLAMELLEWSGRSPTRVTVSE